MADTDMDIIPVRLPYGTKAVVHLPRSFTLADGVHLMNFLTEYVEECVEGSKRATPPSPSTAPEELKRLQLNHGLLEVSFEQLKARAQQADARILELEAALASRPAEVDDEGLPPFPEPFENWDPRYEGLVLPVFTAEQYRQGQRDAVAADRARRKAVELSKAAPSHTTNKDAG